MYAEYVGKYCIIRSREQGVMAGFIEGIEGRTVKLRSARQLYAWSSTFVLIELANKGPRRANEQRYSEPSTNPVLMLEACGVIPCTDDAAKAIQNIQIEAHA